MGVVIPRRLGSKSKIVSLRATHRVAPTTLDVKGIVSATFTTPDESPGVCIADAPIFE